MASLDTSSHVVVVVVEETQTTSGCLETRVPLPVDNDVRVAPYARTSDAEASLCAAVSAGGIPPSTQDDSHASAGHIEVRRVQEQKPASLRRFDAITIICYRLPLFRFLVGENTRYMYEFSRKIGRMHKQANKSSAMTHSRAIRRKTFPQGPKPSNDPRCAVMRELEQINPLYMLRKMLRTAVILQIQRAGSEA